MMKICLSHMVKWLDYYLLLLLYAKKLFASAFIYKKVKLQHVNMYNLSNLHNGIARILEH